MPRTFNEERVREIVREEMDRIHFTPRQYPKPKSDLERAAEACEQYAAIQYGDLSNKPKGWICKTCVTNHDVYAAYALRRAAEYIRSLTPSDPSELGRAAAAVYDREGKWRKIADTLAAKLRHQYGYGWINSAELENYDKAVKDANQ